MQKFSGCETRYQKQLYDRNIKYQEYQKNDLVWLLCPAVPRGRHRKFHRRWDGPYVIKKKLSDAVYQIQREGSRKRIVVHFNRLKPFFSYSNDTDTNQRVNIPNHSESNPSCIPEDEENEILISQEENIDSEPSLRRSTRIRQPVDRYGNLFPTTSILHI